MHYKFMQHLNLSAHHKLSFHSMEMESLAMKKTLLTFVLVGILAAAAMPRNVLAQVSVATIVSPEFFNGIINQAPANCVGKRFYTRQAFLNALGSFPNFGKLGSDVNSKREIAAFFAHATHETEFFCFTEEEKKSNNYCEASPEFPCAPGKSYYGRGPIQLTGNINYGKAGKALGLNLLNNPELVATDPVVSFKTALWYWMNAVRPVVNQGFGATIKAINGPRECGGQQAQQVQRRIRFYTDYCKKFGVDPGANLSC